MFPGGSCRLLRYPSELHRAYSIGAIVARDGLSGCAETGRFGVDIGSTRVYVLVPEQQPVPWTNTEHDYLPGHAWANNHTRLDLYALVAHAPAQVQRLFGHNSVRWIRSRRDAYVHAH